MNKETIIDNEFASLWYYPDHKIIHHKFHRFISGQAFRDVMNKGAELFEQHGCVKWLSDDRENPVLNPVDKAWGDENWSPRVMAAGWKYWALIMPKKAIGQHSMKRAVQELGNMGIEVFLCDDPEQGLAWLVEQGKSVAE